MTELRTLKVALLGCGNVGAQVARILLDDADMLASRAGARLELTGIAVRNLDAPREVERVEAAEPERRVRRGKGFVW